MSWSSNRTRKRPRKKSSCLKSIGWLMRRVAVWQTLHGWRQPWMMPEEAARFLAKRWKWMECEALKEFAYDTSKRWHE